MNYSFILSDLSAREPWCLPSLLMKTVHSSNEREEGERKMFLNKVRISYETSAEMYQQQKRGKKNDEIAAIFMLTCCKKISAYQKKGRKTFAFLLEDACQHLISPGT